MGKRSNWKEFEAILSQNRITKLYHFTDRDNLESIINVNLTHFCIIKYQV